MLSSLSDYSPTFMPEADPVIRILVTAVILAIRHGHECTGTVAHRITLLTPIAVGRNLSFAHCSAAQTSHRPFAQPTGSVAKPILAERGKSWLPLMPPL